MIYVQVEERMYKAKTFKSLVRKMWAASFDDSITKKLWMFDVKERVKALYDKHITSNNFEQFIRDMDRIGLVKLMRCSDCDNYCETPRKCMKGIEVFNKNMIQCPHMTNKEIKNLRTIN